MNSESPNRLRSVMEGLQGKKSIEKSATERVTRDFQVGIDDVEKFIYVLRTEGGKALHANWPLAPDDVPDAIILSDLTKERATVRIIWGL